MGTSWGLTGPQFLARYGVVADVGIAAALVVRWWPVREPVYPVRLSAEDIGFLAGGPLRAYLAAIGALMDDGRLIPPGRTVEVAPGAHAATPLEAAVIDAVRSGVRPRRIPVDRRVTTAMGALKCSLAARGLAHSPARRRLSRLLVLLLRAFWIVGWVRLGRGFLENSPVRTLFYGQVAGFFVLIVVSRIATVVISAHARRLVRDVRSSGVSAAADGPEQLYGQRVLVAAGAGVGVARAGALALRSMDPVAAVVVAAEGVPDRSCCRPFTRAAPTGPSDLSP